LSRTRFGDFAAFGETGTVLTVGFLTIEERRKRNVVGDVADRFLPVLERDFGGHVYQEKLHWFSGWIFGSDFGEQV
jgi:hypothetical protein